MDIGYLLINMSKTKEILVAVAAVGSLAACSTGPSPEEIARQQTIRAAFDAAEPAVLEVGGAAQILPVRDLGENTPPDYPDQHCIAIPVLNCNLHNFVYDGGDVNSLYVNGKLSDDPTPDCKIIFTRKEGTLESGEPGPVSALVAVVKGRTTPQLSARVLADGTIEVCDVAAQQKTPGVSDGFLGAPVVLFVKDPITQATSLRSPDKAITYGPAPKASTARRNPRGYAKSGAVI